MNGARKRSKIRWIKSVFKTLQSPDIICLQETHSDDYFSKLFTKSFLDYHTFFSHGTSASRGVAMFIKKSLHFKIYQELVDTDGRYIFLKGSLNKKFFTIGCIYAPSDKANTRKLFFDKLLELDFGANHLVMGDYNSVINSKFDRNRPYGGTNAHGDAEILNLLRLSNSIEAWRHTNRHSRRYSYARQRQNGPFSRIDYAFISKNMASTIKRAIYLGDFHLSDHQILKVDIDIGQKMIGHDFHKVKPHIFSSIAFKEGFNKLWSNVLDDFTNKICEKVQAGVIDPAKCIEEMEVCLDFSKDFFLKHLHLDSFWWQDFKDKIAILAFKVQRNETVQLNANIKRSVSRLQTEPDPSVRNLIEKRLRNDVEKLNKKDWNDSVVFDRLHNEKCSKNFLRIFNLEKTNLFIDDIEDDDKNILTTHHQKEIYLFKKYKQLYNLKFPIVEDQERFWLYANQSNFVPKVPISCMQDIDEFSVDEIEISVKQAKGEKCPGLDGIRIEFYKQFFPIIGPVITKVFNNIFTTGVSPKSWETSVLKLIPKCDGMVSYDTLRPLTLIVDDRKLYCTALAARLTPSAATVVNEFQTGGIRGRSVHASILLIHLMIQYFEFKKQDGYIFSLDNKKAFDRINREFLFHSMRNFGFEEKLVVAVENLYSNTFVKLLLNGYFTGPLPVTNGVQQGCPLSAILYVLAVEPLARRLQSLQDFQDFSLPNLMQMRTLQHMDDMSIFCRHVKDINESLRIISEYNVVSGAELNLKKSFIIKLRHYGSLRREVGGIKILPPTQFGKILGIYFGSNIKQYVLANWDLKIEIVKKLVEIWHSEDISTIGRAMLLNLKILSRLSYTLSILELPTGQMNELKKIMCKFMNKGNIGIKLEKWCLPKDKGGMGVLDLKDRSTALKLGVMKGLYFPDEINSEVQNKIVGILYWSLNHYLKANIHGGFPERDQWVSYDIFSSLDIRRKFIFFKDMYENLVQFNLFSHNKDLSKISIKEYYNDLRLQTVSSTDFGLFIVNGKAADRIWNRLFLDTLDNKVIALNYRLMYQRINVVSLGKKNSDRRAWCSYCLAEGIEGQVETIEHIFITCPVADLTWEFIKARCIRFTLFEGESLPIYGHSSDPERGLVVDKLKLFYKVGVSKAEAHLVAKVLFLLWRKRCTNFYQNKTFNHQAVISQLIRRLKLISFIDKNKYSRARYESRWGKLNLLVEALTRR